MFLTQRHSPFFSKPSWKQAFRASLSAAAARERLGSRGEESLLGKSAQQMSASGGESQSSQQRPRRWGESAAMAAMQLLLARCLLRATQAATTSIPKSSPAQRDSRPGGAVGGMARWRRLRRVTGAQPGCVLGEGDILPRAMRTKGNN